MTEPDLLAAMPRAQLESHCRTLWDLLSAVVAQRGEVVVTKEQYARSTGLLILPLPDAGTIRLTARHVGDA